MSWFWRIIFLCFTFLITFSDANHHRKLPSAVVVGTVYCHSCILQNSPRTPKFHSIPGASVVVECKGTASKPGFQQEVKTNGHGEFTLQLPFPVRKHDKKINGCSVKVIRSNNAACAIPATAVSSSLHLKSRQHDRYIFSAGFFTFKPQLCDQKQSLEEPPFLPQLSPLSGVPFVPPTHKKEGTPEASQPGARTRNEPSEFFLPPNPLNPPLLPFPPNPFNPPQLPFPPNPLQPPPSIFPPVFPSPPPSLFPPVFPSPPPSIFPPFFPTPPPPTFPPMLPIPPIHFPTIPGLIPSPSPPPSIFPPFFPTPPPPTFPPFLPTPPFHFPTIPGLIPSPSPPPPPPPSFPIPIPPFPFQPTPGFPGVPPADDPAQSKSSKP